MAKLLFQNYDMVRCAEMWLLKRWMLSVQQEKIKNCDYCEDYSSSISNKMLLWFSIISPWFSAMILMGATVESIEKLKLISK